MFNKVFLKRLGESALVAFVVGFGAVATAGSGSLSANVLGGAVAAGVRAVYGVIVKNVAGDSERGSLVK